MRGNRNWFENVGSAYARFRPTYPTSVVDTIVNACSHTRRAADVGCGTGQFTRVLADRFDEVVGIDSSADQIAHAGTHRNVRFHVADAESLPIDVASVDLVVAAQAAHWFEQEKFYAEVRRVSASDGLVALICYGAPVFDDLAVREQFDHLFWDELAPYWPSTQRLVDEAYTSLDFPFHELELQLDDIVAQIDLPQLIGYVSTWSATRIAIEAGRGELLESFEKAVGAAWGEPGRLVSVRWPLGWRVGRVHST